MFTGLQFHVTVFPAPKIIVVAGENANVFIGPTVTSKLAAWASSAGDRRNSNPSDAATTIQRIRLLTPAISAVTVITC
jgi:hypothetical protein